MSLPTRAVQTVRAFRRRRGNGLTRIAAVGVVFLTVTAGLLGGVAEAHTGTLQASAECQSDGTYTVTYSGTTTGVPAEGAGHVATLTVTNVAPVASTITGAPATVVGNTTFSFQQTGVAGSTTHAQATASLAWGDGATSAPQGTVTLSGTCGPTVAPVAPGVTDQHCTTPGGHTDGSIDFPATLQTGVDHWTISQNGSQVGPNVTTGSVTVPPGTYTVTAVAATGFSFGDNQSSFVVTVSGAGDCVVEVTPVAPTVTDQSCTGEGGTAAGGSIDFPATLQTGVDHWVITQGEVLVRGDVTTGSVSLPAGSYLVTAVPADGYTFGDHQAAFNLTIATPEGGCSQIVQPVAPTATPATCTGPGLAGNGAIDLGAAQAGVESWTITQNDEVVATAASGSVALPAGHYVVTASPAEGVSFGENQSSFDLTIASAGDCVQAVVLVSPSVTQADCTKTSTTVTLTSATYTLPPVKGVTYTVNGSPTPTPPGTYDVDQGPLSILVSTLFGYQLPDGSTSQEFNFVIDAPPTCVLGTKVTRPPTRPVPQEPVTQSALPFSGFDLQPPMVLATSAIVVGGLLVATARRRRLSRGR